MSWSKLQTRRLRGFLRLTPTERATALHAALLMPLISIGLRLAGLPRVVSILTQLHASFGSETCMTAGAVRAERTVALVEKVVRGGIGDRSCLRSSLALWHLLMLKGIATEVRIGVRKSVGKLDAHAWVELNGIPLNDAQDVDIRYLPFSGLATALTVS